MDAASWYLIIGLLLLLIALIGVRVARWPLTTAVIYLVIGVAMGRLGWMSLDVIADARWLEIASEIAVTVSLFSVGLKLRLPFNAPRWRLPLALATVSMTLTVAMIAVLGVYWLGLPLGAAVVLGAVLAPTDPVLASDLQVTHTRDTDPVRTTLTGEAGMNDGTAFPLLMLGLGLLGQHALGAHGLRWLAVDVVWMVPAGAAIGVVVGSSVAHLVLYLRRRYQEALGFDDFLALGLIATAYGAAHLIHAYGFVAVFAAGWAVRAVERRQTQAAPRTTIPPSASPARNHATDPRRAPAVLAEGVLRFNDHMDRIGELALVLLVGALLATMSPDARAMAFAAVLLLAIRPLAVAPICAIAGYRPLRTALVSWFGIRGIGSIYYLAYAITHGLSPTDALPIATLTLTAIAASTVLHGVSSTPLMRAYAAQYPTPPSRRT